MLQGILKGILGVQTMAHSEYRVQDLGYRILEKPMEKSMGHVIIQGLHRDMLFTSQES